VSRVVFVLLPQVHLLDLAGPAQVFGTTERYHLSYVAEATPMPSWQGLPLAADLEWPALGPDDLVLVPGYREGHGQVSAATLNRIAAHHAAGGTVASVCAGAAVLGRAGLLDGRRCTTHHELQNDLAHDFPAATVIRDVLYVCDDRVVTSAGIASGIDLALHLVAQRFGPATAARVAREMVVYARRNGDERQASAMLRYRGHLSDVVHRVQDRIDAEFTAPLPLPALAGGAGVSERTLTRLFGAAIGRTPLQYQQVLRVERAEYLIGHGTTVEAAARAVGFTDARMLRKLRCRPASEVGMAEETR
jgi:transcriptional regulator GlxA family with amidase domain